MLEPAKPKEAKKFLPIHSIDTFKQYKLINKSKYLQRLWLEHRYIIESQPRGKLANQN